MRAGTARKLGVCSFYWLLMTLATLEECNGMFQVFAGGKVMLLGTVTGDLAGTEITTSIAGAGREFCPCLHLQWLPDLSVNIWLLLYERQSLFCVLFFEIFVVFLSL